MRADEFLVEAGLENSQLRKHAGKYLGTLINKIRAGEPLEIVPDKQARFGEKVIVDASAADELLKAYFGTTEIPDMDKDVPTTVSAVTAATITLTFATAFTSTDTTGYALDFYLEDTIYFVED